MTFVTRPATGSNYTQIIQNVTNNRNVFYSCGVTSLCKAQNWTFCTAPFIIQTSEQFTLLPSSTRNGQIWSAAFWVNPEADDPPISTLTWTISEGEVAQVIKFDGCTASRSTTYCHIDNATMNTSGILNYYITSTASTSSRICYAVNTQCSELLTASDFINGQVVNSGETKLFNVEALPTDCVCFTSGSYSASTPIIPMGGTGGIINWDGTKFQLLQTFTTCNHDLSGVREEPPPQPSENLFQKYWWFFLLGIVIVIFVVWIIIHFSQRYKSPRGVYVVPETPPVQWAT